MNIPIPNRKSAGSAMIEVLIAILVTAFALLALAGLQGGAMVGEIEAYERSQALVLVQDMVSRINANRKNAESYVLGLGSFIGGSNDCPDRTSTETVDVDLCQWRDALNGISEKKGTTWIGGANTARGCIVKTTTNSYLVTVAWQGTQRTKDAINDCAETELPTDGTRRAISLPLTIATLGN